MGGGTPLTANTTSASQACGQAKAARAVVWPSHAPHAVWCSRPARSLVLAALAPSAHLGLPTQRSPRPALDPGPQRQVSWADYPQGKTFTFTAFAWNAVGRSTASTAASYITPAPGPTAPGPPTITGVAQDATNGLSIQIGLPASNGGSGGLQ